MSTDSVNDSGALVYQYPDMVVLLGPTDGAPPSSTDAFENVTCLRVVQSAGGSRMDFAELQYGIEAYLTDRSQPESFSRMVEVQLPNTDETRIHIGDYVRESYVMTQDGEGLTAQSQVRPYHFGEPVTGYDVWSALINDEGWIDDDIVFNPTVDDQTLFNMSSKTRAGHSGRLWTHPECCQTESSEDWQNQTREEWTVRRAIEALCELLNPDEDFIRNPVYSELTVLDDATVMRDVRIPLNSRLPQILDILLIPLGFNWFVNYDTALDLPKIEVFKIGSGTDKELYLQAPGESLNLDYSNVNQFDITNNIGDSFNQVRVLGQFEEIECTIPLYAAWDEADDDMTADELDKDEATYDGKEHVWRLWIANEAGDIDPLLTRLGTLCTPLDLSTEVEWWIPHRRTLGEPLTYMGGEVFGGQQSKQRRPVFVEYSIDAGGTWEAAKESWSIKMCPDQIGILFDGDKPPSELVDAGDSARVRVTGTVFGDKRLEGFAAKQTYAVNARTFETVITAADRFQKRRRLETGDYASTLADVTENGVDTRDDTDEILAYAEALRDQNQYAEIDCEFRLPGWHLEYQIGDIITKINGREINLDAAPATAPSARYVQIVERRFEMSLQGGPSTVLIVDRGFDQNAAERLASQNDAKNLARYEVKKTRA